MSSVLSSPPLSPRLQALLANRSVAQLLTEVESTLSEVALEDYRPYPKQLAFHASGGPLNIRERLLIAANQVGKAQPLDEPVLTPGGWVAIGSLAIGDKVISGDGSVTRVVGVYPQGMLPVFRLTFDDGSSTRCSEDHLWAAKLGKRERFGVGRYAPFGVYTLREMRAYGGDDPSPGRRAAVPTVRNVALRARAVPLDPYLIGVLLGDGCWRGSSTTITSADESILRDVSEALPPGHALSQSSSRPYDHAIVRLAKSGRNIVRQALHSLGLAHAGSADKFVPPLYLWNSAKVRLAVLQGLMDTDGSVGKNGAMEFCSISARLADDVEFLARSFGAKVQRSVRTTRYSHGGESREGRESHRVRIRLPHVPVFRLKRKLERCFNPTSTSDHHILHKIEAAGEAECVCIAVEHQSRTYVTRDFIVTHNTWSAGAEHAMHLTGRYPDWWPGTVFDEAVVGWAASETGQTTRDTVQRILMGRPGAWGTGAIPKDAIKDIKRASGSVPDMIETIVVRHGGGGDVQAGSSILTLKTYDQGRLRWQGETLDFVWFDEEPPEEIYFEGLTRTNARGGIVTLTFTPLKGMSAVVRRFLQEKPPGSAVTTMTIDDAGHYTPAQREAIKATYPAHERDARIDGTPVMGSGRVFPLAREQIAEPAIVIPRHWPRISGIDFGWDHPTAVVWLAWDRDTDTVHLYDAYRKREATPVTHAAAIKARGDWIPCAWPHDGEQHGKGDGEQLKEQYRTQGVNMLRDKATHAPERGEKEGTGGYSLEAGLTMMLDRMLLGQLKVAAHLNDWWEEFLMYHREDGKVVDKMDDLMSATRYALMMLRHAKVKPRQAEELKTAPFRPSNPITGPLG